MNISTKDNISFLINALRKMAYNKVDDHSSKLSAQKAARKDVQLPNEDKR